MGGTTNRRIYIVCMEEKPLEKGKDITDDRMHSNPGLQTQSGSRRC